MKNALRLWGEVNFKAKNWTEALKKCVNLVQQHQQRNNAADALKKLLDRSLNIIKILSEHNTKTSIIQYPELIKYLALQVKSTDSPPLIKSLCETIGILLTSPAEDLRKQLNEFLENSFLTDSSQNCFLTIKLLFVMIEVSPADIGSHIRGLLALTINLIRDLSLDSLQKELKIESIQCALKILHASIPQLTDEHKRSLKQILSMVFETHIDLKIITDACRVMERWLQSEEEDSHFSVKDQCTILMKIFSTFKLEIKSAALPLELAVRILSTPSDCYEPRILLCKAVLQYLLKDPSNEYKQQFNAILKDLIGVSLWRRLLFVFDQSENSDSKIWTKSSLDFLLGGLEDSIILENTDMDEDIDISLDKNTAELLRQHFKYINKNKSKCAKELIHPLRQLLNFPISNMLFTNIFPQIWSSLSSSQQNSLVFSIENMLLHKLPPEPYDTNSGKTILVAVSCCSPLPYIRPEILQYLAKVHNAWNICMPLLESYTIYLQDPNKSIGFLEKLHTRLCEREYSIGYKLNRTTTPACRKGLQLALCSKWEECKDVLASVMESGIDDADISREMWEESAERLGDWKLLIQYGEQKQDLSLLEYYWQDKRYNEVASLVSKLNISSHPVCVVYKNLDIFENKFPEDSASLKEIEMDLENCFNGIFAEWSALPKHPGSAHLPLIQLLDLRNEMIEGINMLRHLEEQLKSSRTTEKSETTEKWKVKIVSQQDGLKYWNTVLRSRKAILKLCQKCIEKNNQNLSIPLDVSTELYCIDLTYAKLLRKVGVYSEASTVLSKINAKDKSNELYLKSREEVQLYIASGDLENALSHANYNSQNDLFSKEAMAEFRRFKGEIYRKMRNYPMAARCFKNAFQGNPKNMHTLLGLGKLMTEQYPNPTPSQATEIMCCFLMGIQHRIVKYKCYIPRILNLLEICDNTDKWIEQTDKIFSVCSTWLYQIFKRYEKTPGNLFEGVIRHHTESNPQAVFFILRNFVESKDCTMEKALPRSLVHIYHDLKKSHCILISNLESLCEQLTSHFKPTLEEELYSVFTNLIYAPTANSLEEYREIFDLIQLKFFCRENEEFIDKYLEEFQLSFNEQNFQVLDTVMKNMKKWKDRLSIEIRQYETRFVDQECSDLSNFHSKEIEIPFSSESAVIIERITPKIQTLKVKNCNKIITFKGSNYKEYDFLVSFQSSPVSYQTSQILTCLQHYFQSNTYKIAHRIRGSSFEPQFVQSLGCRYYLIEMKPRTMSLKDIYELTINEEGSDPEFWLDNSASLPTYLFSSYMQRILQSPNRYALFRKQFTAQWALLYVFCMLFKVSLGELQLSKIFFSVKSGVISFGLLEAVLMESTHSEFRLTPNIVEVIGQAGIDGVMPAVIINAFIVLRKEIQQLYGMLKLILGEKMISFESLEIIVRENCDYEFVKRNLEYSKNAHTGTNGWMPGF